jgi:hypothetical protein
MALDAKKVTIPAFYNMDMMGHRLARNRKVRRGHLFVAKAVNGPNPKLETYKKKVIGNVGC